MAELSRAQERNSPAFKNGSGLNPKNNPAQNWFEWVLADILMRECQEQVLETDRSLAQLRVPASSGGSAAKYRLLGEWHALRQEWREAAERLGVVVEMDRVDGWETITLDYFKLSLALVEAGRRDEFNRFRDEFVARYGHTTNATAANRVIKSTVLLPASQQLLELLEPCARACEEVMTNTPFIPQPGTRYRWNCWSIAGGTTPGQATCAVNAWPTPKGMRYGPPRRN